MSLSIFAGSSSFCRGFTGSSRAEEVWSNPAFLCSKDGFQWLLKGWLLGIRKSVRYIIVECSNGKDILGCVV